MFATSLSDHGAGIFWTLFALVAFWSWYIKRWAAKNPDVGRAANDAVKSHALGLIGRLFKK